MPDYRKLYLKMFHATEEAVSILIAAQQECEEIYMEQPGNPVDIVPILLTDVQEAQQE